MVDDELVSREKMKRIMGSIGTCDEAASGQEALEAVARANEEGSSYDLITLDISMPEMNGPEVLARIRELEQERGLASGEKVKIFMVTASSEKDTILSCIKSGWRDYIMRP